MSNTYAGRNETLREMGFATYKLYLASELWASIKARAYARHGRECIICLKRSTELHHFSYSRTVLMGDDLAKIVPICGGCHIKIEFKKNGDKRTLAASQTQYKRLAGVIPKKRTQLVCSKCGNKLSKKRPGACRSCANGMTKPFSGASRHKDGLSNKQRKVKEIKDYAEAILEGKIGVSPVAFEHAKLFKETGRNLYLRKLKFYKNGVGGHSRSRHLGMTPLTPSAKLGLLLKESGIE